MNLAEAPFDASLLDPHEGHRDRARQRFLKVGADALEDYELLELILHILLPRRDTKAMAKELLQRFGSFSGVLGAAPDRHTRLRPDRLAS